MSTLEHHGGEETPGEGPHPTSEALPPSIELAWGLHPRPRRGPKPGLSLERIVAAGIKVALHEGLGVLSMGRVASELGVGTMSLYRYVTAKDELLTLMVDTAIGAPPPSDGQEEGWRAGLTRWAIGVREAYRRHPWALRVPISGPPLGPNNVAWLEAGLGVLAATPLSEQEKVSTILLLSGFVRNEATLTADLIAGRAAEPALSYGALLARLTDPAQFPAVHRVIAAGAFDEGDDPDAEFDYGLARILDGVEKLAKKPVPHGGSRSSRS
jgi:AcrR family transcriptional regulator